MKVVLQAKSLSISLTRRFQVYCGLMTIGIALSTAVVSGLQQHPSPQEPTDQVSLSLHSDPDFTLDRAANHLPSNTIALVSVDQSAILNWSAQHRELLIGDQSNEIDSTTTPGIAICRDQCASIMQSLSVSPECLLTFANGRIVLAKCPAEEDYANVLIVDSVRQEEVDELVNRIRASIPGSTLSLETIDDKRCFTIENLERRLTLLPVDDQLWVSDESEVLQGMLSHENRLAGDAAYLEARNNVLLQRKGEKIDIFGFIRPRELVQILNLSWPLEDNSFLVSSFFLKSLLEGETGLLTESLAFAVSESSDELQISSWMDCKNLENSAGVLNPLIPDQWNANSPAGLHGRTVLNLNWDEVLEQIGPIADEKAGAPGSFARALDSLRLDPRGPMVDMNLFVSGFSPQTTFSWQNIDDELPTEWMLEIPVPGVADRTEDALVRLLGDDFDLIETRGLKIWVAARTEEDDADKVWREMDDEFGGPLDEDDEAENEDRQPAYPRRSFSVIDGRLVIASSPEMVTGMHEPTSAGRDLQSTTDFNRVVTRISRDDMSEPCFGFWFERLPTTVVSKTLHSQNDGWRIETVFHSRR